MPYSFVGSAVVQQGFTLSAITVDFSGIPIASGDLGFVVPVANNGGAPVSHTWGASGWTVASTFSRDPGTLHVRGTILQRQLNGTETTVTFTDSESRGDTVLALVVVYRGVAAVPAFNGDVVPTVTTTTAAPWSATGTTDTTATLPTFPHILGVTPQVVFYLYILMHGPGTANLTSVDPSLIPRVDALDTTNVAFYIAWYDEAWASSSNLPSRAISGHWSTDSGALVYSAMFARFSGVIIESASGGDAWAWVG